MSHIKTFAILLLSFFIIFPLLASTASWAGEDVPSSPSKSDAKFDSITMDKSGNVLRFAVHVSSMGTMDPHYAAGSQDRAFADMVFSGLLRYMPGNAPKIEPDLAIEMPIFKIVNGRQCWIVKLRRGVMFHSGPKTPEYELTADDVVYSFTKAANKEKSAYSGGYIGIVVNKIDKYTVEFIPEQPMSSFLFFQKITNHNGGFIVSKKAIEKMGYKAYQNHPIGTGPFKFKNHHAGVKLSLDAHINYFRGKPALDGVEIHFIPDIERRKTGLLDGTLDVIIGSGKKEFMDNLLQNPGIEITPHGPGEVTTIHFNTSMPPMDDIRVREAVIHALNREQFLDVYEKNSVRPVFSPVPVKFLPGGLTQKEVSKLGLEYKEDLKKAKALLSEAGYPNGFHLDLVGSEKRTYRNFYRILKEQLARINIDCTVKTLAHAAMHKAIREDPRAIVIYSAWRPNADAFLTQFFHSDSILITGKKPSTNFSHYSSIDKLIENARFEINPKKQILLWEYAQIKILSDKVAYPVMYAIMSTPRRDYVDYGHSLKTSMALYPQFTEKTKLLNH